MLKNAFLSVSLSYKDKRKHYFVLKGQRECLDLQNVHINTVQLKEVSIL